MNLESTQPPKPTPVPADELLMDDFDFKPITSGLGFHQPKPTEIKPAMPERVIQAPPITPMTSTKKEMSVYQNDLSMFYGANNQTVAIPELEMEEKSEIEYRFATKSQRVLAYIVDFLFLVGVVGITLTVMARTISMDLIEVWSAYPNEITPLVATIFCGFYLIYFSIFEKASQSTIGKNIMGIKVVSLGNKDLSFSALILRTSITLVNFVSLGLFSYFDLQNKITNSKVVRVN